MSLPIQQRLVLNPASTFDELRAEWSELAERSGNIFSTPEWCETWWRHFGRGRPLRLFRCHDDNGVVAILPLYVWRNWPVRVLRFVGHGGGDELGPVCAPEDRPRAAHALVEAAACAGADLLLAERLPQAGQWTPLFPTGRRLGTAGSPVIRFGEGTWDDLLASRSRNFREQVRRRERVLLRDHELTYRLVSSSERLDRDLDVLFALHGARWGRKSSITRSRSEPFHRDFAALALDRGWLRLWFLDLDGRTAAGWLGYRFGNAECYYQAGRDPRYEKQAVGFVLLVNTIRSALADSLSEYRLLRGGEGYKYRFATDDPGQETIGIPLTIPGSTALWGASRLLAVRRSRALRTT